MTLSDNILNYLRGIGWTAGGTIERQEFFNKHGVIAKPSSVARALRNLEEKKIIFKDKRNGSVWYFYNGARIITDAVERINQESIRMKKPEDPQQTLI